MPVPWKSSLSPYQSSAADPNLQTLSSSEDVAHTDPVLGPQFVAHISSSSWFACSNALSLLRKAEAEKDKQYLPDSQLKERKKPRQKEPNVNNMVEKSPPALQEYISCRKCMRKKKIQKSDEKVIEKLGRVLGWKTSAPLQGEHAQHLTQLAT